MKGYFKKQSFHLYHMNRLNSAKKLYPLYNPFRFYIMDQKKVYILHFQSKQTSMD